MKKKLYIFSDKNDIKIMIGRIIIIIIVIVIIILKY